MEHWVLPIFPDNSLASSVVTTAWVGVFVVAFLNLRLGWVLSGLVVPGYLVPLLIARPWAAGVIFVEAVVSYLIVWFFSERLSGGASWSSIFGRDRFMALVLSSVLVRILFDLWLLPGAGEWVNSRFGLNFDYESNLHSFGLIIVALLANQFWKPGLIRGLAPVVTMIGVTYLIVRYGLMEFTNFRISGVAYLYEDIAASLLASPKAYIILLVTAILASRMNLLYGWEFNGILIPALIALQWYQPIKILSSFVEAFVILFIGTMVLRAPIFANMTMEGARKILLFFNISFAYRMILAYVFEFVNLDVKATDYFGFGYLLSTLIAMKMYDKQILARLTRATLQISLTGAAVGSVVGFGLTLLPWSGTLTSAAVAPAEAPPVAVSEGTLGARLLPEEITLYGRRSSAAYAHPARGVREAFAAGVSTLAGAADDPGAMERARQLLNAAGYRMESLSGRHLLLLEQEPARGRGFYVLDPRARNDLIVQVPDPLALPGLLPAALRLFEGLGARGLAVAGVSPTLARSRAADVLRNRGTMFLAFDDAVRAAGVVQVRSGRGLTVPRLQVLGRVPEGLDVAAVERLVGPLDIAFGRSEGENVPRASATASFAELLLNADAARRVRSIGEPALAWQEADARSVLARVAELLALPGAIAEAGSGAYRPPRLEELLFLDEQVLKPILTEVAPAASEAGLPEDAERALVLARRAAAAFGYELALFRDGSGPDRFLLLWEAGPSGQRRFWGTYLIRLGPAASHVVQVPRPRQALGTLGYGSFLFRGLDARALMVSGAHSRALPNGEADVTSPAAPPSLFGLVSQALVREAGEQPLMIVQARPMATPEGGTVPPYDALLATYRIGVDDKPLGELGRRLRETLTSSGLRVGLVNGGAETVGYEVGRVSQALYLAAAQNKEFALLWLAPHVRSAFGRREPAEEIGTFLTLGMPVKEENLLDHLEEEATHGAVAGAGLPAELRDLVGEYLGRRDVVALRRAQTVFPQYEFTYLHEPDSGRSFLVLKPRGAAPVAVANLAPLDPGGEAAAPAGPPDRVTLARYLDAGAAWLLLGAAPAESPR